MWPLLTNQRLVFTLFAVDSLVMSPCIWMTPGSGAMAWNIDQSEASINYIDQSEASVDNIENWPIRGHFWQYWPIRGNYWQYWLIRDQNWQYWPIRSKNFTWRSTATIFTSSLSSSGLWDCYWHYYCIYKFLSLYQSSVKIYFSCCRIEVRNQFAKRWQGFDEEQNWGDAFNCREMSKTNCFWIN